MQIEVTDSAGEMELHCTTSAGACVNVTIDSMGATDVTGYDSYIYCAAINDACQDVYMHCRGVCPFLNISNYPCIRIS